MKKIKAVKWISMFIHPYAHPTPQSTHHKLQIFSLRESSSFSALDKKGSLLFIQN